MREFEEEYSVEPGTLPFQESGYAQAFDLAKRELKWLLVVLLSPEHDDTAPYIRDTLLAPEVVNFIKDPQNNIVLWAGSVQDSEAYQVANAFRVNKFPFAGLVVHVPSVSSTSMAIICRASGPIPPSELVTKLQTSMQQRAEELNRARQDRQEQQASRSVREETNSAYERSLAQDRERARQKREAEAAREKAEQEENDRTERKEQDARDREQWRRWRAQKIQDEPSADVKEATRISVRMPSGERIVRRFATDSAMEELYAFVECYDELQDEGHLSEKEVPQPQGYDHEYAFQLVSPMPREVYDLDTGGTIRSRIGRSGNLIVEKTTLDDEEEDVEAE